MFDSNGPGGRIRGNASQLKEKYLQMARDATVSGDRVLAESLHQFAEHYFRVVNDSTDPQSQSQAQPQSHSRSSSDQRNNQSDNHRHRNSRSNADQENRAPENSRENVRGDRAGEAPASISPQLDSVAEGGNVDTETRKPAPRSRVRSRRPRYEESDVKTESSVNNEPAAEIKPVADVPAAPVTTDVESKPVVAELPLSIDDTPVAEKPKRKPRTPKAAPKAATKEVKTPRPRGRPRKVVAKVEDGSSTETA
ncbi:DUF4167 domain-containing protein [Kiloniella sp.]|uniref:DUF4167 domain-containing protein n=1 Tax=Kiloniella sp. TaxID=1938587 RepID=UPI003B01CA73